MRAEFRPGRDFEPTPVGLQLPDRPIVFEQWTRLGRKLGMLHEASIWSLADWLAYGARHYERSHGSRYHEAVNATGISQQTLRNYASVARRIPLERRRPRLSYTHHEAVAWLPEQLRYELLARAERESWPAHELKRHRRAYRQSAGEESEAPQPRDPATGEFAATEPATLRTGEEQGDEPATELVTLDVDVDRRTRWEGAAEALELTPEEWLAEVADEAAAAVPAAA